ncbi:TPA: hypothetical protein O8U12_004733 [Enterobacter cloacae]|uniref:hypothetical protein n=1 Tax=Enterobacter cloacae complex TaxID=354276 RepID=UPI001745F5F8|nr:MULTISPECIES: hypothetical protein [Enterobacter cloacae complex]MDE7918291.1 hypothetical protein [Enterobacter kobei]HDC4593781.1 hypothetical protein [Enterobacter cloacae]
MMPEAQGTARLSGAAGTAAASVGLRQGWKPAGLKRPQGSEGPGRDSSLALCGA